MITAPGLRQLGQVGELGETVLAGAEQEVVGRERRVEAAGRTRIGADGLHSEADDRALGGEPLGQLRVRARRARAGRRPALRNRSSSCARASQPERNSSQPPSGSRP